MPHNPRPAAGETLRHLHAFPDPGPPRRQRTVLAPILRYASRSIFAAMMKSLRDKPLTVWVQKMIRTFPQVTVSSG